ncbi:MAG TPA: hypothetical protein PKA66_04350 [Gemmatimonadales bacterium]|nr:hypothetical protein [Gemmatimonadales bacterium]
MTHGIRLGLVALALIAAPVTAQQHQHQGDSAGKATTPMGMAGCSMMGNMMQMMGGGMEMMQAMRFLPGYVLQMRDTLQLTANQVSRIEALGKDAPGMAGMSMKDTTMKGMSMKDMPMMKQMQADRARLGAAFDKSPADSIAIQAATAQMASLHARMMAQHLIAAAKVRDLLTTAQREQLAKMPSPCMADGAGMMHQGQSSGGMSTSGAEHDHDHAPPSD